MKFQSSESFSYRRSRCVTLNEKLCNQHYNNDNRHINLCILIEITNLISRYAYNIIHMDRIALRNPFRFEDETTYTRHLLSRIRICILLRNCYRSKVISDMRRLFSIFEAFVNILLFRRTGQTGAGRHNVLHDNTVNRNHFSNAQEKSMKISFCRKKNAIKKRENKERNRQTFVTT